MVDPCPRETQNYHSFSGLFRSPVDTPPEISARGRPGRVREQPLSVSIVSFIVFPCLSHLALHHPVLHFSGHFYHSPTNLLYKFRTTRVQPPPPGETPTQNPKPTIPSYHTSSGPGKMKKIRRLGSPMRRPRRRDQEEERIPRTRTSAGTTEPVVRHKIKQGRCPSPRPNPHPGTILLQTKQKEMQKKIIVSWNLWSSGPSAH